MKNPRKRTPKQKFDFYWRIMAITELSLPAKAVATALLLKFHNEKTGRCDPGAGGIAKAVGLSRRAVFNAIAELKEAGWITVKSIQGGGPNCTNRYSFDFKRMKSTSPPDSAQDAPSTSAQDALVHEMTPDSAQNAHEPLRTTRPPGEGVGEENPPRRAPDGAAEKEEEAEAEVMAMATSELKAQFEQLYKLYWRPYGNNEAKALAAFNRVTDKGVAPEIILASARRWVESTDPAKLQALDRWLDDGAWRNDPPVRRRDGHSRTAVDVALELAAQGHGGWRK